LKTAWVGSTPSRMIGVKGFATSVTDQSTWK
jgi:hypothetical protein